MKSSKAAELASLLKGKKIFYVNIEQPDNQDSTIETTLEDIKGINFYLDGNIITFCDREKTASFEILKNAQIIIYRKNETEIITTFAENGGLQIKQMVCINSMGLNYINAFFCFSK